MKVKCPCIDDRNKPAQIPQRLWPIKDETYHMTCIYWHPAQGVQGCDLLEIALDESCAPYETYQLRRFAIDKADLADFIELVRLSSELDEVNIDQLLEESQLQVAE